MTTARELLNDNVQRQLNDPRGEFWTLNELLVYLNEGLQQMLSYVPGEFTTLVVDELKAGTKQTLPLQAISLLDIRKNVNSDGSAGNVPFQTTKRALDVGDPAWQQAQAGKTKEWAYDPVNRVVYWVSPPASSGNKLEIEIVQRPSVLTINAELPIQHAYHAALADYVMYRAMSKDSDYAGSSGLAGLHYQQFLTGLGVSSGESG
jgi:hypothetical protein